MKKDVVTDSNELNGEIIKVGRDGWLAYVGGIRYGCFNYVVHTCAVVGTDYGYPIHIKDLNLGYVRINDDLFRVTRISGSFTFAENKYIKHVSAPFVTEIGGMDVFKNSVIEDVYCPELRTIVGSEAFAYCGKLKDVKMNKLQSITGRKAFAYCNALSVLILPCLSIIDAGAGVFEHCDSIIYVSTPSLAGKDKINLGGSDNDTNSN